MVGTLRRTTKAGCGPAPEAWRLGQNGEAAGRVISTSASFFLAEPAAASENSSGRRADGTDVGGGVMRLKTAARWRGMAAAIAMVLAAAPAARAAEPRLPDTGSSSRDLRRQAAAHVPLDRMPAAHRQLAEKTLQTATLYRRLPVAAIECEPAFLEFVLTKPECLVDVWRVLDISRLSLDPTGPGHWRLADGYGTVGAVRLLHQERERRGGLLVFHGRGGYTGPLATRPLTGSCLIVVRHTSAPAGGCPRQLVQIDAFLDVDGLGLEIVAKMLQPLIVYSAASNLHEISIFMSQFAAAAERNPAGVARLTQRLSQTAPEDRRALADAVGAGHPGVELTAADDVQAELAARWMASGEATTMR